MSALKPRQARSLSSSRVIGPVIVLLSLAILVFGVWAVWNLLTGGPSIFLAELSGILLILWTTLVVGYFLLIHVFQVESDLWRVQHALEIFTAEQRPDQVRYYEEESLIG